MSTQVTTDPEALVATIPTTERMLGQISRSGVLRLAEAGEIETIKVGGRRMVVVQSVRDYIDRQRLSSSGVSPDDPTS